MKPHTDTEGLEIPQRVLCIKTLKKLHSDVHRQWQEQYLPLLRVSLQAVAGFLSPVRMAP